MRTITFRGTITGDDYVAIEVKVAGVWVTFCMPMSHYTQVQMALGTDDIEKMKSAIMSALKGGDQ